MPHLQLFSFSERDTNLLANSISVYHRMYNVLDQHPLYTKYGQVFEMAKNMGALLIFAEHRFYGKSQPKQETRIQELDTTFPLSWIRMENILADYAHLISTVKFSENSEVSPVVVMGADYGGLLATWFHQHYQSSKLSIGSLAFYHGTNNYLLPNLARNQEDAQNKEKTLDVDQNIHIPSSAGYENESEQSLLKRKDLSKESRSSWRGQKLWTYQVCSDEALWPLGAGSMFDFDNESSISHYCKNEINTAFVTNTWEMLLQKNLTCQFQEKEENKMSIFHMNEVDKSLHNICGRSYFVSSNGNYIMQETTLDVNLGGVGEEVMSTTSSSVSYETNKDFIKVQVENASIQMEEGKSVIDSNCSVKTCTNRVSQTTLPSQDFQGITKKWIDESYMKAHRYVHYQADE